MDLLKALFSTDKEGRSPISEWLPMALLTIFFIALYWSGVSLERSPRIDLIVREASELTGTQLAMLILMVPVIAIFLQPVQLFLIRLQEGYWSPPFGWLSRLAAFRHRRRVQRLMQVVLESPEATERRHRFRLRREKERQAEDEWQAEEERQAIASERLNLYPDESRLLPTKLGNVLRSAEDEAGARYGLDTLAAWPRLNEVLPDRLVQAAANARNEIDLALRFSGTFLLAGIVSFPLMIRHGWWLLVPVVWLLSAWFAYQNAIRAALDYGRVLMVAFDVYRFDLLAALRMPLPHDRLSEQALNERLSAWFTHGEPPDEVPYVFHGGAIDEDAQQKRKGFWYRKWFS